MTPARAPFTAEVWFREPIFTGPLRHVANLQLHGHTLPSALEDGWLRTQNIDHSWAKRAGLGRDERSMSMGDRIKIDGTFWEAAAIGFERVAESEPETYRAEEI